MIGAVALLEQASFVTASIQKVKDAKHKGPGRKPAWRGETMELDSKKKSRRDSMMRSKSFDTQEMREIGRKGAGESRGFPIL